MTKYPTKKGIQTRKNDLRKSTKDRLGGVLQFFWALSTRTNMFAKVFLVQLDVLLESVPSVISIDTRT